MANNEPLIKLDPEGKAPILSYNIPEPTSYSGRNFIELLFDEPEKIFEKIAFEKPATRTRVGPSGPLDSTAISGAVDRGLKMGFNDRKLFPNVRLSGGALRFVEKSNPGMTVYSEISVSSKLAHLNSEEVAAAVESGRRLNVYTTMHGSLTYNYLDEPKEPAPALYLVETYRLSSFLGNYGAGSIVKTFTLLPGEKTKISVKTYSKTEEQAKSASSILDSFTEESAEDFERTVQDEHSDKASYAKSFEYHAEAEAQASWGWGSAKVSGGVKGGTNSAREEFSKNATSSVQKHSSKASAKRDVQVNTSYEVKEERGEETSIEREIENINLSRTLNFVFRQMNQEHISFLHLVDVRLAFFNGFAESRREVTLPEIDSLLATYVVEDRRTEVRSRILEAFSNIFDYKGDLQTDFIEERVVDAGNRYLRVNTDRVFVFTDPIGGREFVVPGIILSVMKSVMRTEGIIAETLLGQGDALDEYAQRLQELEVSRRESDDKKERAEAERSELINQIARDNDASRADILAKLLCPCGPESHAHFHGHGHDSNSEKR